jgi:hypothetical protein
MNRRPRRRQGGWHGVFVRYVLSMFRRAHLSLMMALLSGPVGAL